MKLFLCWSGTLSHQFAEALHDWIPSVIQAVEPFLSSEDMEGGARWSVTLGKELEINALGLICATRSNVAEPWINFEAGALSKALDTSRVIPMLLDLKKSELPDPLGQFQALTTSEADTLRLVTQLNEMCDVQIPEGRLRTTFERWWPDLSKRLVELAEAEKSTDVKKEVPASPTSDDILEDILEMVRQQHRLLMSSVAFRVGDRTLVPVPVINAAGRAFNGINSYLDFLATSMKVVPQFRDAVFQVREAMEDLLRFGEVSVADPTWPDSPFPRTPRQAPAPDTFAAFNTVAAPASAESTSDDDAGDLNDVPF